MMSFNRPWPRWSKVASSRSAQTSVGFGHAVSSVPVYAWHYSPQLRTHKPNTQLILWVPNIASEATSSPYKLYEKLALGRVPCNYTMSWPTPPTHGQ